MYAAVNEMLGDIVKVTPSSKVVGDLALYMLTHNLTPGRCWSAARRSSSPSPSWASSLARSAIPRAASRGGSRRPS